MQPCPKQTTNLEKSYCRRRNWINTFHHITVPSNVKWSSLVCLKSGRRKTNRSLLDKLLRNIVGGQFRGKKVRSELFYWSGGRSV